MRKLRYNFIYTYLGSEKVIETERLIISPLKEMDYEDICDYCCDEETGEYMIHWPKTKEDIRKFIMRRLSLEKNQKGVRKQIEVTYDRLTYVIDKSLI